jgi:sec-independent protein translocase protein TatB
VLNLDPAKLLIIAVVAIILLGPERLPQVARQVGAAWRALNDFRHRMEAEVRSTIPDLPSSSEISRLVRSPTALLDHLSAMPLASDGSATTTSANGSEAVVAEGPVSGGPVAGPDVVVASSGVGSDGTTTGLGSTTTGPATIDTTLSITPLGPGPAERSGSGAAPKPAEPAPTSVPAPTGDPSLN